MRNCCKIFIHIILIHVLLLPAITMQAQSVRQFSNKNGLSNNAVLSLYQDIRGMMWIGTCDGLNVFDGKQFKTYIPQGNSTTSLSGNLINSISEENENVLWIQTNYGLDRLDTRNQEYMNFEQFKDNNFLIRSKDNDIFVLKDDGTLHYFSNANHEFKQLDIPILPFAKILNVIIDHNNTLWIFINGTGTQSYQIHKSKGEISLKPGPAFPHSFRLRWAFTNAEQKTMHFIDETYALYEYDLNSRQAYFIADLSDEVNARGEISSLVKQGNDYYIGFKNDGLIVLEYQPDEKTKYHLISTNIHCGIFCLLKDRYQDIVWIGTDGQGVYMCFKDAFTIHNFLLNTSAYHINNPVRAIYCDPYENLWIGTKGSGILRLKQYAPSAETQTSYERFTTANSTLTDDAVYCFAPGQRNLLWIGTENGLNYYSYTSKTMHELPVTAEGSKVKYVHSIYEPNDTTLWLATVGEGIVRITLYPGKFTPIVKSAKRIITDKGRKASNYFFTLLAENDSTLWLGNRGYGLYRMDTQDDTMTSYRFDSIVNSRLANDIFAIHHNPAGYWLGTSAGLLHFTTESWQKSEANLFVGNTIHSIQEDYLQQLWLGTNQGLTRFDPKNFTSYTYNSGHGLKITEFSDGASFRDPRTGILYFGGTDGFVTITPNFYEIKPHIPPIHLRGLSVLGKPQNLSNFLKTDNKQDVFQLKYNQNIFQIDFMAVDYINGDNYTYYYRVKELNGNWVDNGTSTNVVFSNLAPGKYTLQVKYRNNACGQDSEIKTVIVRIIPPWYLSQWAYAGYVLLAIALLALIAYKTIIHYRRKQRHIIEKLNQQKKEEVYESKLRFFTNITHEFCTPLTLIYGPCERILAYKNTDTYVHKYASMIKQNAEKLNSLILELLEFRRLETGNKALTVQAISVSQELQNTATLFCDIAENRGIDYRINIAPNVVWNTDLSCFNKIAANLISNAFKYTPDGGHITVYMTADEKLTLSIANSGKGIAKEDLPKIFDRYKILDSFEVKGKNSRTGLGLAICKSMTALLGGSINVDSIPEQLTTFTVTLPPLKTSPLIQTPSSTGLTVLKPAEISESFSSKDISRQFDEKKQTIMIIDDDPSMLWFVSEIFEEHYNVLAFDNATDALATLEKRPPTLIISDVMMPGIDGLSFAQKLKQNKLWNHIPLILLSALHYEDDQVKGLESGADAYVTKPFNTRYLKKIVERLIERETELKTYHRSSFSSVIVEEGKVHNAEDREFIAKIEKIVSTQLANPALSVEMLSSELGYSTRQFYRKLKEISGTSPSDFIKECRIVAAERLLLEQNLTIEEIMDRTGFNNRGTFYKIFSQRYGMSPAQYRKQQKEKIEQEKNDITTP